MESIEELHFAKVKDTENYAFIHSNFTGKLLSPGKSQYRTNLSYNELALYLAGACFAKNYNKFHLFNGISEVIGKVLSPNSKFSSLEEKELEKLVSDANLDKDFKNYMQTDN